MPELMSAVIHSDAFATDQPTLTAHDDLALRPWTDADAATVYAAFQDPDIRHWHVRTAESVEQVRQWIVRWRSAWACGNGQWAVTSNGEIAGRIGLRQSDLTEGVTELAYWTLPARRGHSIAPRAANIVTRWAFHDIGFDRIELTHSVHNAPSCRVAEKSGFRFEGTLRQAGRHSDGRHDMHLHARLRTD
ncbi:GNAT family N-acetyltransferase [Nocardia alba]|uniref:RimJ/RimL family protein N-acetyltransferase n=1 Tax=Nocardia alba TaxID=225051 RepID=A0A4R1FWC3_9NOCA|nr:GNAT family N-acetyltransferase [Nocardia alba]TCJ96968.1 RimJ/RimL family protein N-acetyltransferase [Nocardia alba]